MSLRTLVSFAAAFGLLLCSVSPDAAGAPKPVTHTVSIDGTSFEPAALTINVGDSVVWVNKDPFPHTVTSKAGGFDSKEIPAGESWKYTAATKGEFPYACTLHPTMKATLRVK